MIDVIGLDLSLIATGISCGVCGRTETITSRVRGVQRLAEIEEKIVSHVTANTRQRIAVIEGYAMGAHNAHAHELGELGGVVRLALHRMGVPMIDVPPATLKKFTTGKGNAGKDEVIAEAIRRFEFPGSSNNEADAWMLARIGETVIGERQPARACEREAIAKLDGALEVGK